MFFTWPSPLQSILCIGSLYCAYHVYWGLIVGSSRRKLSNLNGCGPVKLWRNKDPILGLDIIWESIKRLKEHTILEHVRERIETIGSNTFKLRIMRQHIIVTTEPENLKSVLSLDFKSFALPVGRKEALAPLLGEGIFTNDGEAWQHSRSLLRPIFTRSQINDLQHLDTYIENLIQVIPTDGSTVDLQGLFLDLTFDIATEFLFGESANTLVPGKHNEAAARFTKAFTYVQNAWGGQGDGSILSFFLPNPQIKKNCKIVHEYVDTLISENLAKHQTPTAPSAEDVPSRYILLHALATLTPPQNPIAIRSELLNILLAGRDTTAALLTNVWFELSKRSEIYSRLRAEVDALSPGPLTFEQIKDMKYLRAILNESLRLYPIVPENSRQAVVDTVLPVGGGKDQKLKVLVPKGTIVAWSLFAMHRDTDLYGEDADVFRPERWLDEGKTKGLRVGWEFLPFNGGPRICLGQQLALSEASYVTVRLMQEFSALESRDPEPWRERLTLTCTNLGGCKVGLTPRL